MPYIEEVANAELNAIFGPYAYSLDIAGVTAFQHVMEQTVTRRGQNNFGNRGPVAITVSYQGESGAVTIEGAEAEKILSALLSGNDPASHVVDDPRTRYPLVLVSNTYEDDGTTPIKGSLVFMADFENMPRPVGPEARSYNFQAMWAKDVFGKEFQIDVFSGSATPVTALALGAQAAADADGNYAQVVLRQTSGSKTVTVLEKTTDYTETNSTVTLVTGLGASEKAIVISIKS